MSTITAADCASDYALFCEFYDTGATTTRDEFDAMSYEQKWLDIAECFADNSRGTEDESRANAELDEARAAMRGVSTKYEIIDNRTDKSVAASALLASADWLDENGRVIFDDLDEAIDNGDNSVYRVIVGDYVAFVEVENQIISLHDAGTTFEDYLDLWDTGDATTAELFAEWGLDGLSKLSEVDDDYVGTARVWVEHNYVGGTFGAPTDGFARDDDHDVLTFATAAQAREWIDELESGTYYLAHGEAGSPAYTIVEG